MADGRMELLDGLSGFEFEDLMEDVFRNLGYENVRQAAKTADVGRDILMEETVDGTRRAVVVECKHTDSVGRPVVQKLHSAVATYEYDGPKRGIVVTTGRFTGPAEEYAAELEAAGDPHQIELLDGRDLRRIADDIGLDLYNARIEIICEETLRPYDPTTGLDAPVREAFQDIENIDSETLPEPAATVSFQPVVIVTADTNAVFETSVGVIHRINERTTFVVRADRGTPRVLDESVTDLVEQNLRQRIELDEAQFEELFDAIDVARFGQTQTEYKEWAIDQLQEYHTTTVTYTGDNNVTYTKTCEPNQSDISVQDITPVYVPQVRQGVTPGEYTFTYEYYAAGPSRVTIENEIHACVHCSTSGTDATYTYCANCGSINCQRHIRTERLEGTPVCTGCAVTESFMVSTKYFYDDANLEAFREEYAAMPIYRKPFENTALVGAIAMVMVGLVVGIFLLIPGL